MLLELTSYLLSNYSSKIVDITPLKLQKLLFYIKAWGMVGEDFIIPDSFEKWGYGPVAPEVYHHFKNLNKTPLNHENTKGLPDPIALNESQKQFIDMIMSVYGDYTAFQLSELTHSELPWKKTKTNEVISDALIKEFYSTLSFAKNFPVKSNSSFYPLKDFAYHSFVFDMKGEYPETIFSSFQEYKLLKEQAELSFNKHFN